jgi:acyl carrier protein
MVDEVVKVVIDETGIDAKVVGPTARLNDLGLTSYSLMRLLMRIEDHFGCEFDASDLYSIISMSIEDLLAVIERSIPAAQ